MSTRHFDIRIAIEDRVLVDIRDFPIEAGRITFLFGESGIGKSLIARALYGLLDPAEFNIVINNEPYESYLKRTDTVVIKQNSFYVFQEPSSHLNPLLSMETQLSEGSLSTAGREPGVLEELWEGSDPAAIQALLDVYPKPYRPSGGEKQRMFLAMALRKMDIMLRSVQSKDQSLFVFDEPTGNLDNRFRNIVLSLFFKRFQLHNFTTLLITHDYSMVSEVTRVYGGFADRIAFKELGIHHGELAVDEFKPATYLGWLGKQNKSVISTATPGAPLMRIESGVEVFGHRLIISKDAAGETVCSLDIFPGTVVYLKAPSGTGKTTIIKAMMGLVQSDRLQLMLDGMTVSEKTPGRFWQQHVWGKKMALVFQHADEALNPEATVAETFRGLPTPTRMTTEEIQRHMAELFDQETIAGIMGKKIKTLSGGQKQRLNLLRSLALNTDILILDEPLNGLDFESTTRVLAMIGDKQKAGKGVLLISHNEEIFDSLIPEAHVYHLHSTPV